MQPDLGDHLIVHRTDTTKGNSGSPMIVDFGNYMGPTIVGIHTRGQKPNESELELNVGVIINDDKFGFLFDVVWGYILTKEIVGRGTYEGERDASDRPHGKGFFQYVNGSVYVGDFREGLPHGLGVLAKRRLQPLKEQSTMISSLVSQAGVFEERGEEPIKRRRQNFRLENEAF